jgi:quercetin dioxygenase-like cupin family protein
MTAPVRMQARARLPRHRHVTSEQLYMAEGDGHVAVHVLKPGDYYQITPGSIHDVTYTEDGCLFLLIASHAEILS